MTEFLTIAAVGMGCLIAVALTALRLPGTWLLTAGAGLWGWFTDWRAVSLTTLAVLVATAVVAEVVELVMSAFVAQRAGGSRRAAWGGLVGGFLGMIFLSFLVPVLFVGSMVGAVLGCFLGAAVGELSVRSHLSHGTRVGLFAALGLAIGTAAKVGLALVMSAVLIAGTVSSISAKDPQRDVAASIPVAIPESQP